MTRPARTDRAAKRRSARSRSASAAGAWALSTLAAVAVRADIPGYQLQLIGLGGLEHTRSDGYQLSTERVFDSLGQMAGISERFKGSPFELGQSAWYYNPDTNLTLQIGLIDGEHSTFDGFRFADILQLQSGFVVGFSDRYRRTVLYRGQSIWEYNAATNTTTNIGLTDADHTRTADGYRFATFQEMDDAGQVLGYSNRYTVAGAALGQSLWFYNPGIGPAGTTVLVGLTDAEHTRNNGLQNSSGVLINSAGRVVGRSDRFNQGSSNIGQSVWYYTPAGGTTKIGLFGLEYTDSGNKKYADFYDFDSAGDVVGLANRFNGGSTSMGQSLWYFNGASLTTSLIGLADQSGGNEHMRADGFRISSFNQLTESGNVIGDSTRYNGGTAILGQSAWFYNRSAGATLKIGLVDAAHTIQTGTLTGYRFSSVSGVNSANQVTGVSTRYDDTDAAFTGQSAWLYDPATNSTTNIGLTEGEYKDPLTNLRYSFPDFLNQSGQVAGNSDRYALANVPGGGSASFYAGQSAWLYSPGAGTTTLILPPDSANVPNEHVYIDPVYTGFTYRRSDVVVLTNSGQVVGVADRHNGGYDYKGESAWFYNSATGSTTLIGLGLNESTLNPGTYTIATGSLAGYKFNSIAFGANFKSVNDNGQVVGFAMPYNSGSIQSTNNPGLGRSLWFYNPSAGPTGTTTPIGLTDPENIRPADQYRWSDPVLFDNSGRVAGDSARFSGTGADLGQSAWFYSPALGSTTRIGLTDATHTRTDGYRFSAVSQMNQIGQVLGSSTRYIGSGTSGQSAWIFDPAVATTTFSMVFSMASDGSANTLISSFDDTGLVVGDYEKFSGNNSLGLYAFRWSRADGFFDLGSGSAVVGGLGVAGASGIAGTMAPGPDGSIYGTAATRTAGGNSAWRLKPVIVTWAGGPATPDGTWQTSSDWDLGTPHVENPVVFNLPGTYAVSFTGSAQAHAVNVTAGQVSWNLPGCCLSLVDQLRVGDSVMTPTVTLSISSGTLDAPGGVQVFSHATLKSSAAIEANVNNAGTFVVPPSQSSLVVGGLTNSATIQVSSSGVLRVNGAISNTGTIDLADGDMIVDYTGASPIASLLAQIVTGYNGGGWNGMGIRSSLAAGSTTPRLELGIGEASTILGGGGGTFDGQAVDGSAVLIKFTYAGDATLDGRVDIRDLRRLAQAWHTAGSWTSGDFDYNGVVDAADLGLLARDWQAGVGSPLGAGLAGLADDFQAIPEPGITLAPAFMALLTFARSRRRRRSHRFCIAPDRS